MEIKKGIIEKCLKRFFVPWEGQVETKCLALSSMAWDELPQKLLDFLLALVTTQEVITDSISHRRLADTTVPNHTLNNLTEEPFQQAAV